MPLAKQFKAKITLLHVIEPLPYPVDFTYVPMDEGFPIKVLRDDEVRELPAELVPGDVALLEAGDNVPADCRLVEAFSVGINSATITGESISRNKVAA